MRSAVLSKKIVIIGGGPGGYEAALMASKYGADITIVEDSGAGGSAIRKDVVPSKSFIAVSYTHLTLPTKA